MKASRGVLIVALALLALAAIRDLARLGEALPWRQLYDFSDFYCAGAALDRGSDPYRYEPLHACEHAVNVTAAYRSDPARVVPSPLPPYDLPAFMMLAHLPFASARSIDATAIVLAVIACVFGLTILRIPLDVAALALFFPAAYILLNAGQIVPFALVALIFCGVALTRQRDALAGVAAALTMIEPHLGLPVCAAMLLWIPRSRLAVVAVLLALTAISASLVGVAGMEEFALRVLPAQAVAETGYAYQYSVTYLLHALGVPERPALLAGACSYAIVLIFALWLARLGAARIGRRELMAYLPAACSVIAGSYVHMVDLPFALPALVVLAVFLRSRWREVAAVALCLLAVPWIAVWITKKLFLTAILIVALLLLRLRVALPRSLATFATIAVAIYLLELTPPAPLVATTQPGIAPTDLAQQAWRAWVEALPPQSVTWILVKVPTWTALLAMLAATLGELRSRQVHA